MRMARRGIQSSEVRQVGGYAGSGHYDQRVVGTSARPDARIRHPGGGYRLPDGSYLENTQLEPDVKVANSPETIIKGEDTQLKTAVEELLKQLH